MWSHTTHTLQACNSPNHQLCADVPYSRHSPVHCSALCMLLVGVHQMTDLWYTLHSVNECLHKVTEGYASVIVQSWVDLALQTGQFLFVLHTREAERPAHHAQRKWQVGTNLLQVLGADFQHLLCHSRYFRAKPWTPQGGTPTHSHTATK